MTAGLAPAAAQSDRNETDDGKADAQRVPGHQIVACIVAQLEGNTSYFGTATTATKLKCEFTNPDYQPTLAELYAQGWRLIEVLGGNHAIAMGNSGPSPLYLLERPVLRPVP